jgi:hypothetical protein
LEYGKDTRKREKGKKIEFPVKMGEMRRDPEG